MTEPEPKSSDPLPSQTPTADRLRLVGLARPGKINGKGIADPNLTREEFDKIADKMFDKLFGGLSDDSKGDNPPPSTGPP